MSRISRVVESKRWKHPATGRTASLYGACPWSGAPGDTEADWTLETVGWTWELANGTVGLGRRPAATKGEAEEIMRRHNERFGTKS